MSLEVWGAFFFKMFILLAGVFVIALLTPKLAAFIDKRRSRGKSPEEPRPERVEDDENAENNNDEKYKSE